MDRNEALKIAKKYTTDKPIQLMKNILPYLLSFLLSLSISPNLYSSGIPAWGAIAGTPHPWEILVDPGTDCLNLPETADIPAIPVRVDSFRLPVIPPAMGVQFYKEGIVFLSSSKINKRMTPQHVAFGALDTYYASLQDTLLGEPTLFSPDYPFPYPPESFAISRDYQGVYFTRYSKKDQKMKIHKAIFTATLKKTGWLQDQFPLPFCNDNFNYAQPALSADGTMMIFASDRSGSKGGMDLFMTSLEGDAWSEPKSLGSDINTTGDELFPFLDRENNLYFSSYGHTGYGGFDLYVSFFLGNGWTKPVNLTEKINSEKDELALTINPLDGSTAFYTRRDSKSRVPLQLMRISLPVDLSVSSQNALSEEFRKLTGTPSPEQQPPVAEAQTTTRLPQPGTATTIASDQESKATPAETKKTTDTPKPGTSPQSGTTKTISGDQESIPTPTETTKTTKTTETPKTTVTPKTGTSQQIQTPAPEVRKPEASPVIYRVQLASSTKSKPSYTVKVGSTSYKTWEYYYKGAYRITIGEFPTLKEAVDLQNLCRKSGYPQAFVAAFKDGVRSTDAALFR